MSDKIAVVYIGDKAEQRRHGHRQPPGLPAPYRSGCGESHRHATAGVPERLDPP